MNRRTLLKGLATAAVLAPVARLWPLTGSPTPPLTGVRRTLVFVKQTVVEEIVGARIRWSSSWKAQCALHGEEVPGVRRANYTPDAVYQRICRRLDVLWDKGWGYSLDLGPMFSARVTLMNLRTGEKILIAFRPEPDDLYAMKVNHMVQDGWTSGCANPFERWAPSA